MTNCTTCRIGGQRLTDDERRALRHAHVSAGIRYVSCHGCGGQRWPWDLPAPDLGGTTGTRLVYTGHDGLGIAPYWRLYDSTIDWDDRCDQNGLELGHIIVGEPCEARSDAVYGSHHVCFCSLADCARALVDAVRKDEPQHGPDWRVTDGRRV